MSGVALVSVEVWVEVTAEALLVVAVAVLVVMWVEIQGSDEPPLPTC